MTTKETSRRNPIPMIIVNESRRSRTIFLTACSIPFGFSTRTFQMMFRELCSSLKTPRAPNSRDRIPSTRARTPSAGLPAFVIRPATNSAPSVPTRPRTWPRICACTSPASQISPVMAMTMISRGAMEKIV